MEQTIAQQIRRKLDGLKGIEIISLAIFGSTARQENDSDSDLDLLVVAEGIAEKRVQRIPDMIMIKQQLDLRVPLDILLVSKEECQLNFKNHNPLYLDIALDAGIICDDSGFLKSLIEETREYIDKNNIHRDDDSWSFPVKQRTATVL